MSDSVILSFFSVLLSFVFLLLLSLRLLSAFSAVSVMSFSFLFFSFL